MKKHSLLILLLFFFFLTNTSYAETIYLKSGAVFEGTITEKTDSSIKLDTGKRVLIIKLNDIDNDLSDMATKQMPSIKIPEAVIIKNPPVSHSIVESIDSSLLSNKTDTPLPQIPTEESLTPIHIKADDLPPEKDCLNLPLNLENCTPYKCTIEDPLIENFISTYTIYGVRDEKCFWKQTLPNNGVMRCQASENSRKKIAQDLKSNPNNSPTLEEAFTNNECRISGYEIK